jgi:hypothetical protein
LVLCFEFCMNVICWSFEIYHSFLIILLIKQLVLVVTLHLLEILAKTRLLLRAFRLTHTVAVLFTLSSAFASCQKTSFFESGFLTCQSRLLVIFES